MGQLPKINIENEDPKLKRVTLSDAKLSSFQFKNQAAEGFAFLKLSADCLILLKRLF